MTCSNQAAGTNTMAWVILATAGLLEIVWSIALKHAAGMSRLWPTAVGVGIAMISLGLLSIALTKLPVGTAYAVWVGIGTIGVTAAGIVLYDEPASWQRLSMFALIAAGIIGLKLSGT